MQLTMFSKLQTIFSDISNVEPPVWMEIKCEKGEFWRDESGFTAVNASVLNVAQYLGRSDWDKEVMVNGSCHEFTTAAQEYFRCK